MAKSTIESQANSVQLEQSVSVHPCFSVLASKTYGRIHLPVAPSCNVQCGFCNRSFDCVAEARPGVTSSVLTPAEALEWLKEALRTHPEISVVGIAGPGDPLANAAETLATFRLVKDAYPDLKLCLSTNGLVLKDYLPDLIDAGLSHITITINSFTPEVAAKIYQWVRLEGRLLRGVEAAEVLIDRQKSALAALEGQNIPVKINIVLIPGINDDDIPVLVNELKRYPAVTCVNIMPLIPVEGSKFENLKPPSKDLLNALRSQLEPQIPQIRHCCQCRSDAVGLLNCNRAGRSDDLVEAVDNTGHSQEQVHNIINKGTQVAVASSNGRDVSEHFGHASIFQIYRFDGNDFIRLESREIPPLCCHDKDEADIIEKLSDITEDLSDCSVIICTRFGPNPRKILESEGFNILEKKGHIKSILRQLI
ncbi:MAG: radical SAM protein [Thermoplasmata archaeon]|nr:MAG: radical SAM protein [Thermoplasmata archaeon]